MEDAHSSNAVADLGIIGGGPAGTMAAIEAAQRGLQVLIWERERFPRDKVCGEFLSPETIPLLSKIIPETLGSGPMIRRADFCSRAGRTFSVHFAEPGRGLSRLALDEALWRAAAAAGAVCLEGESIRRIKAQPAAETCCQSWEVASAGGKIQRVRQLMLACGRWWKLDGFPSPADSAKLTRSHRWLGLKAHFKGIAPNDAVEMYFFPGGYCGLAPIEGGLYNACCLVRTDLARPEGGAKDLNTWLKVIARHPALDERLQGAIQVSKMLATAPVRPARRGAEAGGALLAGDAAGFLDPFTGEGISLALHSGRLAAEELAAGRENKLDWSPASAPGRYHEQLSRGSGRSYVVAALLRTLVGAPAELQDWATAMMPRWLGARLLAETRWHCS